MLVASWILARCKEAEGMGERRGTESKERKEKGPVSPEMELSARAAVSTQTACNAHSAPSVLPGCSRTPQEPIARTYRR